eukprot:169502-Pelagomonas_calceolata.AAC.1
MDCPLQTVHLSLLKRILGIKRTLLTGLNCGNVDMNLYNLIGSAQQLGYAMLYCAATALHSAKFYCPIVMRELVVDLRNRLRGVWTVDALAEHGEHTNK